MWYTNFKNLIFRNQVFLGGERGCGHILNDFCYFPLPLFSPSVLSDGGQVPPMKPLSTLIDVGENVFLSYFF